MNQQRKPKKRSWRPHHDARTYAQALGLRNKRAWDAFCLSGEKPDDIPSCPNVAYGQLFQGYGDWLGNGNQRPGSKRSWRPYPDARTYVRSLGLPNQKAWDAFCLSGEKPDDIPSRPEVVYNQQFQGYGDWLGNGNQRPGGKRAWRPYPDACTYVRSLGLSNQKTWEAFCLSGKKPDDIPSCPNVAYNRQFRGYADWLGLQNKWTKNALLAFLQDLQSGLPHLPECELYVILQQGGALPALRIALKEKAMLPVFQQVLRHQGQVIRMLQELTDEEVIARLHIEDVSNSSEDILAEALNPAALFGELNEDDKSDLSSGTQSPENSFHEQKKYLHVIDSMEMISGRFDAEAADYLITSRVQWLWEIYNYQGQEATNRLLVGEEGGRFFTETKHCFLSEVEAVEQLDWTKDWAFTVNGQLAEPNLMQRRIAWMVREKRRVGNWSGVGAGKTISAILASRVCDAHLTLVITNYPTLVGWKDSILNVYPDSDVYTDPYDVEPSDSLRFRYLILNYEQFQGKDRQALMYHLLMLGIEFICLDEIQLVKQRERKISERSKQVKSLITQLTEKNANIYILGMSATPVINSLTEAKRLLELITGEAFSSLGTTPTIHNALMMHRALMQHGVRFRPRYEQEMRTQLLTATCNDLVSTLETAQSKILTLEQTVLPSKLDLILPYVRPGTVLYTHYLDGILPHIEQILKQHNFSVGFYTGADKSGLQPFLDGELDLLIGSSAVGTGLDGLQHRCNRIILLSLPWTGAALEQLIGRIRRQGSHFTEGEIIVPQITLEAYGEHWSWDEYRWQMIHLKRTLSDCVSDGRIPEAIRMDEQSLLCQSRQALHQWVERVNQQQNDTSAA